jgi:hypothetical protein
VVRLPAGAGIFSPRHRVQTGSWAHPAPYGMGTASSFTGDKAVGGVKLTTHLHLAPRLRSRGAIAPLPPYVIMEWYLFKHSDFTFTVPFTLDIPVHNSA